jgi:acyl-CoA thioesterase FadM
VFEVIADTSHFTPLQLQPRAILALSFNGMSRWLREHLVSFPELIRDHRASLVILAAGVEYGAPLRFFDGEGFSVRVTLQVKRGGTRAELTAELTGAQGRAATARILLCPVHIDDPVSLAAAPAPLPETLLRLLSPGEVDPASPGRPLVDLKSRIEQSGERLAAAASPFVIHRHLCEVADQWAFFEVPGLIGAGRESLALARGQEIPALRAALALPLARVEIELTRPYFWFQRGEVETTAYLLEGRLALIHRLVSAGPGGGVHGTAVELF